MSSALSLDAASKPAKPRLDPAKFRDRLTTAKGEKRAHVSFAALETLWFNTGTLCNLTCTNCYIDSSPTNDRLAYISAAEVAGYLDEISALGWQTREIGFTGGEPFMNPELPQMLENALARGFHVLVLTNAMRPMMKQAKALEQLIREYGERLTIRVSVDHFGQALHEAERGANSWTPTMHGIKWLNSIGANLAIAGRTFSDIGEAELRAGFARLFKETGLDLDAQNPAHLVLFPEMDMERDVPEITEACWGILRKSPEAMMCATSRMVVKPRETGRPMVVSCTLLPYAEGFALGETLAEATRSVSLNHPHCARFCVLGGASCSAR